MVWDSNTQHGDLKNQVARKFSHLFHLKQVLVEVYLMMNQSKLDQYTHPMRLKLVSSQIRAVDSSGLELQP